MTKTRREWLSIFSEWIRKAEALKEAGLQFYLDYCIFASNNYLSLKFVLDDVKFEKKDGGEADEEAYNAINSSIDLLIKAGISEYEERIASYKEILSLIKDV